MPDCARFCAFACSIPPHFCLWRICGATTEKAPQRNYLVASDLAPETRNATPPSFMFQYPPSHLNTRCLAVSNCLNGRFLSLTSQLSPFVAFCFQLWPIVVFCRQLSTALAFVFVAFCGLLLLLVASCGLLRLFVASSRTVAICRECPRLSQTVPPSPNLSPVVPDCPILSHFVPATTFFNSEAQRCTEFFLTFSCFEVP